MVLQGLHHVTYGEIWTGGGRYKHVLQGRQGGGICSCLTLLDVRRRKRTYSLDKQGGLENFPDRRGGSGGRIVDNILELFLENPVGALDWSPVAFPTSLLVVPSLPPF